MRLYKTEITPLINNFFYVDYRSQPFLACPYHTQPSFHSHPELELVYIEEGFGKRIIGNKVERFEKGDMVFIGSHVPHIWLSHPNFYKTESNLQSKVIVTYFNPKIFQQIFNSIKEFEGIKDMFNDASKGIRIVGETRKIIAARLKELSVKTGFEKVECLLRIMYTISISKDKIFISNEGFESPNFVEADRLIDVINYIHEHYNEKLYLKDVAGIACLTEQSFSRFFKIRMKKNFSTYLEDLRISNSLSLLVQSDKSIGEIADVCGFNCSSHFCKVFKDHTGLSPYQYKRSISRYN